MIVNGINFIAQIFERLFENLESAECGLSTAILTFI